MHGEGQALALQAHPSLICLSLDVLGGVFPARLCMARDRPSPYSLIQSVFPRAIMHGEGQALALQAHPRSNDSIGQLTAERDVVTDVKDIADLHRRSAEVAAPSHHRFQD